MEERSHGLILAVESTVSILGRVVGFCVAATQQMITDAVQSFQ